jgi:RNA polymerase sigma-70 factor (ECF subfamily)
MEEVFQEVSVILWEEFEKYDEARPFLPWALGIARIQAARWRRERARFAAWLDPEVEAQLARSFVDLEDELAGRRLALSRCLERLGAHAREMLAMRYERGLSLQDIAHRQQRSVNAVNKALAKIRNFLAECTGLLLRAETHQ